MSKPNSSSLKIFLRIECCHIMFFKWFNATEAKNFGVEMAELISHRTPYEVKNKNQERLTKNYEKRHLATLVLIEKRLENFKKNNRLNVYTKAQLGSSFKYALLDSGYEPEFCNQTTTWLLLKCK
ncbi:MAG: hypothetical protein H7228_09640 [Polaromonas sp.]|nr:hypothetical protein [Polaromonas sp.]